MVDARLICEFGHYAEYRLPDEPEVVGGIGICNGVETCCGRTLWKRSVYTRRFNARRPTVVVPEPRADSSPNET